MREPFCRFFTEALFKQYFSVLFFAAAYRPNTFFLAELYSSAVKIPLSKKSLRSSSFLLRSESTLGISFSLTQISELVGVVAATADIGEFRPALKPSPSGVAGGMDANAGGGALLLRGESCRVEHHKSSGRTRGKARQKQRPYWREGGKRKSGRRRKQHRLRVQSTW